MTWPRASPHSSSTRQGSCSALNKLMYDLGTTSAIDTFTGRALSGPLQDANVKLKQVTVVTSTWE